jgi:hypothetical protein
MFMSLANLLHMAKSTPQGGSLIDFWGERGCLALASTESSWTVGARCSRRQLCLMLRHALRRPCCSLRTQNNPMQHPCCRPTVIQRVTLR